ncbi:MAG TPA: response regulator [Coleofasciculaceae cyanobacterium]|jgi:chemotaxis protein histidine kinase CheA/ActR/RegA family two-component response regulator
MSSQLDPVILAAITAEARQCFLNEDAPEYLQMLNSGFHDRANPDFTALLRAAHSLKGGAGLASLTSLQYLAHKLEDVLVGLQQSQIGEIELAWALVEKSIDEVGYIISQARTVDDAIANPELMIALESLVGSSSAKEFSDSEFGGDNHDLIRSTLTEELENSFVVIEELEIDAPAAVVQSLLSGFVDECTFLAETLDLVWLGKAVDPIVEVLETTDTGESLLVTKEIISYLRTEIGQYLDNLELVANVEPQPEIDRDLVTNTLNQDLEAMCQAIADLGMDTPEAVINEAIAGFADECIFLSETLELPWLSSAIAPIEAILAECDPLEALLTVQELVGEIRQRRNYYLANFTDLEVEAIDRVDNELDELVEAPDEGFFDFPEEADDAALSTVMFAPPALSEDQIVAKVVESQKPAGSNQVRISLEKLEGMTNHVEELILSQSRISRQQQTLNQANHRLRSLTRQFEPIREQIQDLYNQLAVNSINKLSINSDEDDDFDALEMDRYTDLHTSLQSFQELMLQIQETRTDIDFVDRELAGDLEQTEKNLDILYAQVTDSRLVPFDVLAKRFIPQIRGLGQRFDKPVNLEIEGKNTLVDQILLEQLQTPLTHLLNNAFDHGIESKYDRIAANKSETATITLKAQLQNNQLVIAIRDDGGGIDPEKVYHRAVERGICPPTKSIKDYRPEEIVNWIFEPDFSTAAKVSDISGRGMGLDIVLNLISQLRGQLYVTTDVGRGTTFTISLPLNLSLQSLLLVQLQNRLLAIPHTSILEILPYQELYFTNQSKEYINWKEQTILLASASNLFPCPRKPLQLSQGKVAIVLETAFEPLAILVDAIAGEEKLIIKPFDETVPVPTYIVGCTVLGTGEVIPVILPQGIAKGAISSTSVKNRTVTIANTVSTILIAEDSVATRRMLDKVLTAAGYQVLVCRDGQEALDLIEQYQGRIDLILSDVEMPRLNGFELLEKVRAQPAFKNTPIVMATSRTGDRHQQKAKRLGATDYLGKPVQPQQLINTVAALLTKK